MLSSSTVETTINPAVLVSQESRIRAFYLRTVVAAPAKLLVTEYLTGNYAKDTPVVGEALQYSEGANKSVVVRVLNAIRDSELSAGEFIQSDELTKAARPFILKHVASFSTPELGAIACNVFVQQDPTYPYIAGKQTDAEALLRERFAALAVETVKTETKPRRGSPLIPGVNWEGMAFIT